jgi:nicotinamidase-related amidase
VFTGSDLDVVLRSLGVEKLVIASMITSSVVLSTVYKATDKDFKIVVLRDLYVDFEEETNRVLIDDLFVKRGAVVGARDWIKEFKAE